MNRNSLILLSLVLVLGLLFAACVPTQPAEPAAVGEEQETTEVTEAEEEEAAMEEFFIGHVQHSSIPYTQQMRYGFEAACEDLGVECEYNAPETVNPEVAIGMFETMMQKGADAIILNAAPPEAWGEVVKTATDQDILVNALNNYPDPEVSGFGAFVWPGEVQMAYALANEFFGQLKSQGVDGGQIVWGICAPGYVGQEQRADGWEMACAEQSDFECVGPLDTGHSVELDYAFWETTILQYPDAVGFAGNCAFDGPNLAKLKVLNDADWGAATFDLEPETLDAVADGQITAAMGANPYLNAYVATKLAYDHLVSGEPIKQGQIQTLPELVTAENVEEFLAREEDLSLKHEFTRDLVEAEFSDLEALIGPFEGAEVPEAEEEEAAMEEFFIGHVQHSSIPYTQQMRYGFEAACEDLGVECEYNAPETVNPEVAIGMFETMMQKGADAIILNAAPPEAWGEIVKTATDQDILVNALNNYPDPEVSGFGVFVWPGEVQMAYALANEFFGQLKSQGVDGGQIVWGICAPGYVGQEQRADGWEMACAEQSDFECVGPLDTGHSVELDYAFWETTILQHPDAVGFAGNCAFDGPNLAKLKVLNDADWGAATFDLEPETLDAVADGQITAAMGANPYLNAYVATKLAYDHLVSGEPIKQGQIQTLPELVTAENVEEFLAREEDLSLKHEFTRDLVEAEFSDLEALIGAFE